MKKNTKFIPLTLISILVLLMLIGFGYYFWRYKYLTCQSPIQTASWKDAMSHTSTDDSGLSLSRLFPSYYIGTLSENSRSFYHSSGEQVYQILAGEATLYSGHLDANKNTVWYAPLTIKEGESFHLPPNIVLQIEPKSDHPLVFSLFAPDTHFKDDRYFVDDYDPSKSQCK